MNIYKIAVYCVSRPLIASAWSAFLRHCIVAPCDSVARIATQPLRVATYQNAPEEPCETRVSRRFVVAHRRQVLVRSNLTRLHGRATKYTREHFDVLKTNNLRIVYYSL